MLEGIAVSMAVMRGIEGSITNENPLSFHVIEPWVPLMFAEKGTFLALYKEL